MRWDLEKRSQASSTWNTCTSTPSLLAKKPSGGFHIVITFARVGWCCKLHPLLMLAKRRLHPLHYCFMEVHNQVRSHVCLLPDTSIQGYHEVLWCCHPISRHQSVHKGHPWQCLAQRLLWKYYCCVLGNFIQKGCYSKACWCLSASNQQLSWVEFFRKVYSQLAPSRIAALTGCPPPESVKGLPFFIGTCKVFSRVLPCPAPTPIQPTLDCDWWFSN